MKNNRLLHYFKNYWPILAIGALLTAGGVVVSLARIGLRFLGTPLLVGGIVLLVVGYTLRVSDAEYMDYFTKKIDELTAGRPHERQPDFTSEDWSFDGNTLSKIDGAQMPRTETYIHTDFFFGKNALEIERCTVTFTTDKAEKDLFAFPNAEVHASTEDKEVRVKGILKKTSVMTLTAGDVTASFPVKYNDIETDQLVERINELPVKK